MTDLAAAQDRSTTGPDAHPSDESDPALRSMTPVPPGPPEPSSPWGRLRGQLAFRRLSAVYIFAALFVLFSVWVPDTFLSLPTWRSLLDGQALTALAALGLLIPTAAGAFNLALGAEIGFSSIVVSWLLVDQHVAILPAVLLTLLVGALVGAATSVLVAVLGIDSFIATLGIQSVLLACTEWLSKSAQILNLPTSFSAFSTRRLWGTTTTVYIVIVVAIVSWYVLEHTSVGRRIYATGGNPSAAHLAGIRTRTVTGGSFIACGVVASCVGILLASRLGTGDPTSGPSYLLPAFSAVFLGATQFRTGRFNVWGTVVAVYVLAVGVTGFQLAGAPVWIPDLFNGLALVVAVGLARWDPSTRRVRLRSRRRRGPQQPLLNV